jgi:SAM-dependent methyltransferase
MTDSRIAFFDSLAPTWETEGPSRSEMTGRLEGCKGFLGLAPGQSVLEVGCGTGKTTGWLVNQVAPGRVTAVDFAPEMITRAKTGGVDADFLCLDVCGDDLGKGRYDVIFCFHSFPHFRDPSGALRNFARALKPGGTFLVVHLAGSDHINAFHAGLEGPIRGDRLPEGKDWPALLHRADLVQRQFIDQDDLFLLCAFKPAD